MTVELAGKAVAFQRNLRR